jgi:hypothetical protein
LASLYDASEVSQCFNFNPNCAKTLQGDARRCVPGCRRSSCHRRGLGNGPIYNQASLFVGADGATNTSVSSYVNSVVSRNTTILDQLQSTGLHVVMANVADYGSLPGTIAAFPDASKRQLVTDAVSAVNTQLAAIAHTRPTCSI